MEEYFMSLGPEYFIVSMSTYQVSWAVRLYNSVG